MFESFTGTPGVVFKLSENGSENAFEWQNGNVIFTPWKISTAFIICEFFPYDHINPAVHQTLYLSFIILLLICLDM